MQALPRMQVRWLDMGGLATDRAPGIARFKLGTGGQVCTLPGTFLMSGPSKKLIQCALIIDMVSVALQVALAIVPPAAAVARGG